MLPLLSIAVSSGCILDQRASLQLAAVRAYSLGVEIGEKLDPLTVHAARAYSAVPKATRLNRIETAEPPEFRAEILKLVRSGKNVSPIAACLFGNDLGNVFKAQSCTGKSP